MVEMEAFESSSGYFGTIQIDTWLIHTKSDDRNGMGATPMMKEEVKLEWLSVVRGCKLHKGTDRFYGQLHFSFHIR